LIFSDAKILARKRMAVLRVRCLPNPLPTFHDPPQASEGGKVTGRVTIHSNQICPFADGDAPCL
jgi:hypothetical protein